MTCVLHCLFQERKYDEVPVPGRPMEVYSHGDRDRRRTGCLVINSVLFTVDPAEYIGKCRSQQEEVDCDGLYRNRFLSVAHLEEEDIRNGI